MTSTSLVSPSGRERLAFSGYTAGPGAATTSPWPPPPWLNRASPRSPSTCRDLAPHRCPTHRVGARHYAELILPAVRDLADQPLVLVGHSFGGTVAAVLASEHPELVASMVLTGAPLLRNPSTLPFPLGLSSSSLAPRQGAPERRATRRGSSKVRLERLPPRAGYPARRSGSQRE